MTREKYETDTCQKETLVLKPQDIEAMVEQGRKIPFSVHETGIRFTVSAEVIEDGE